jgi:hypothetical protein
MPKPKLILVETDAVAASRFSRQASKIYDVIVEPSAERALGLIHSDRNIVACVAGTKPGGQRSVTLLEKVKSVRSEVLRVMLAAPDDLSAIIGGLHSGAVQRSLQSPVADNELYAAITPPPASALLPPASPARPAGRLAG